MPPSNARVTVTLNFPAFSVTAEGSTENEVMQGLSFWTGTMPAKCGHCESKDIVPVHQSTKGYDFYKAKCRECAYEFPFGQRKTDSSLFPKGNKWEPPFSPSSGSTRKASYARDDDWTNSGPGDFAVDDDDDIPF